MRDELKFDAVVDRHAPDSALRLAEACPDGIDVYFESVGAPVSDTVLPLHNDFARVPVYGLIAHHHERPDELGGIDRLPGTMHAILSKSLSAQGFILTEFVDQQLDDFLREPTRWIGEGRLR